MEAGAESAMSRLRFNTAADLFDAFPTAEEDMVVAPSDAPVLPFMQSLLKGPTPEEAITFCAYLLPRRDAVWWGCRCLGSIVDALPQTDTAFLDLAQRWALQPDEENRTMALIAGMDADAKTPGAWMALGAGWSGGNMMVNTDNVIPAPPYLTAKAINAGILSALARLDLARRATTLHDFVSIGDRVARGTDLPESRG